MNAMNTKIDALQTKTSQVTVQLTKDTNETYKRPDYKMGKEADPSPDSVDAYVAKMGMLSGHLRKSMT